MSATTVHVTRASELGSDTGQTGGMSRHAAISGLSDKINGSVMIAQPHTDSDVHHHGEEDTIVYAASGHGSITFGLNGENKVDLHPGDFALIPAFCEHQEVNHSDEEVVWIITRSGSEPKVVNLPGWGKSDEVKA